MFYLRCPRQEGHAVTWGTNVGWKGVEAVVEEGRGEEDAAHYEI